MPNLARVMNGFCPINCYNTDFNSPANSDLKILSLHVCSIVSKLKCPDILSYLCKFDVIGLHETKIDETHAICVSGYILYMYNRKKNLSNRRSGGIALLV